MRSGIYCISVTRPDGSLGCYVGQTIGALCNRMAVHRYLLRRGTHTNLHLQRAWDKYGESAFVFSTLEANIPPGDLTLAEERWIISMNAMHTEGGFNQRVAAGSNAGTKKPRESIERAAEKMRGRPLSAEHKARIGAANRGRPQSAEVRARISASLTGRARPASATEAQRLKVTGVPKSAEARARMSEGKRRGWALRKAAAIQAVPTP